MAEEKVGFGFEFGIKGDKEVHKSLTDIIRMLGSAGNATAAIGQIIGKAGGLLEFGAAAGPIALAATAMATFAYKSAEAGENLRQIRVAMTRLDRVPSAALTDSQLGANTDATIDQFQKLGLEAGNRFNEILLTKVKNFGTGAYAVNWDIQAAIGNLFGANIQSYEQGSPEAVDAQNRVYENQKVEMDRANQAGTYQKELYDTNRKAKDDLNELYSGQYGAVSVANPDGAGVSGGSGGSNIQNSIGVLPESYTGRQRQLDISATQILGTKEAVGGQVEFDSEKLRALKGAPLQNIPGTNIPDTAGRKQDEVTLQGKINDELEKALDLRKSLLEIDLSRRDLSRALISAQDYGSRRRIGAGGGYEQRYAFLHGGLGGRHGAATGIDRDILGGFNKRTHDMGAPMSGFGGISGSLKSLDVLKSIDKSVSNLGTPTLTN